MARLSHSPLTVWHDFDSLEATRDCAKSDQLREVMEDAGVANEPTIWFTERA